MGGGNILGEFAHAFQRAMDMAMQSEFVPCRNNLLWHFGIPFRNFTDEIEARF